MKYFLYARKSTEDEERQVMSIEAQLHELKEFAIREKIVISETFIESKSAKKPGREIFNQMMVKVHHSKEPVGLIAWHPDRLARNSVDGGQIIYSIDMGTIVSLRFPTFWFEPTPQGLFMLQVAFGQSKYFSDNLSENVKRGIRQKLRRGEWPTLAPFGYVNNLKTRTIEPDPVKSKIVKKVFEEFASGKHSLESIRHTLSFWGVVSRSGKPLGKASVQRILTNPAYLGIIKHKGESYEGGFPPIIPKATFDQVQKVLKSRSRPRYSRKKHDFAFLGLMSCGECGAAITAQYAKGHGGTYKYYRCTKRLGHCSQSYLREELFVEELRQKISKVALRNDWKSKMIAQVNAWEKTEGSVSHSFTQNLKNQIRETEEKLDRLVNAFLDQSIEKETYLVKKEELVHLKTELLEKKSDFGRKGRNWIEPLRSWILSAHQAEKLASSNDFSEIRSFVEKIGTNHLLRDKKVCWDWVGAWGFLAEFNAECGVGRPALAGRAGLVKDKRPIWLGWRDSNPRMAAPEAAALPLGDTPMMMKRSN